MTKRLKMKDLEQATGVGREAIRFYIREGLLPEPDRPARNVAWYDEAFVERIRFIKELQHKRYLPLHVIKALVGGDTALSRTEVETLLALDGKLFPHVDGGPDRGSERLSALAARTGIAAREIRQLADVGAIDIATRNGDQWLDGPAVQVVELWGRLREAGFSPDLGFGPEMLQPYLDSMRWLAREELRLFARGIAGRVSDERVVRMAQDSIDLMNQILGLLRKRALLDLVARGNLPDIALPGDEPQSGQDAS